VHDLVAGSGLDGAERGAVAMGAREWRLFAFAGS